MVLSIVTQVRPQVYNNNQSYNGPEIGELSKGNNVIR